MNGTQATGAEMPPGLLDGVRRWLAESGAEPTPARVAQALREQGRVLGDAEVLGAAEQLRSELVGSGPLERLLSDPTVTDVLVSAPDRVWVDRGGGLMLTLAADYRLAGDDLQVGLGAVRHGILPGSAPKRLAGIVGAAAARRLCLFGEYVGAAEALRIGLGPLT